MSVGFVLLATVAGCLPQVGAGNRYPVAPGRGTQSSGSASTVSASECDGYEINVEPAEAGGRKPGEFQACANEAYADRVWIAGNLSLDSGEKTTDQKICVFPIYSVSFSNGNPTDQVFTHDEFGFPMFSCQSLTLDRYGNFEAIEFQFDRVEFDRVIVVKLNDLNAMRSCLYLERESACPNYSEGRFR